MRRSGYEQGHDEVSQACGERVLFPAVRGTEHDDLVVAPGFSRQIADFCDNRGSLHTDWHRLVRTTVEDENGDERPEVAGADFSPIAALRSTQSAASRPAVTRNGMRRFRLLLLRL